MPEVLRLDIADGAVSQLGAPTPVLDPATAAVVEAAVARAQAAARREGEQAGRAAVDQAVAGVLAAVEGVRAEVAAQRADALRASLELAERLATAVLDATPPPDALAVLDRVREAAAGLDEDHLEVRLHPDDHAMLADAGVADARLTLTADRSLQPGDARLVGAYGGAELTRQQLLAAATDVLAAGAV